jgi:hypothetical protein
MFSRDYQSTATSRLRTVLVALALLVTGFGLTACDDVGVSPTGQAAADNIFTEDGAYKSYLAKLYAGLNVTGQQGGAGNADISGIDEGFSQYIRLWWQMQELPTDEAVIAFNDGAVQELNTNTWAATNGFSSAMYSRIFFQVSQVNEFLRQSTPDRLDARNVETDVRQQMPQWRAEARFLRALSYWHGVDLFGDIPLVEEDFTIGSTPPQQATRQQVFNFVEEELLAITNSEGEENLPPAGQAEYGRADRAAAWMLLSKLYLNAEVYIGEPRYQEARQYAQRVIDAGFELEPDYQHLFLADNNTADGIIFAIPHDGQNTQHFGGTQFLTHAAVGGEMDPGAYGIDTGYNGLRTTSAGFNLFDSGDQRGIFFTQGQSLEIATLTNFQDGYAVPKYQNITSNGNPGSNPTFPDTDYPMFRLAEAYLTYAEATVRLEGSADSRSVELLNDLRERAGLPGDLETGDITLEFLLDERGRELFWEATRRTDLIRFDQYTGGDYIWPWKGNSQEGASIDADLALYPLPASELRANPNLEQNPGY